MWSDISQLSQVSKRQKSMHYARVGTLVKPTVPLRTFVFVLGALIYFAIFAELVLLVYLLETTA